jgi:hypothetical protein
MGTFTIQSSHDTLGQLEPADRLRFVGNFSQFTRCTPEHQQLAAATLARERRVRLTQLPEPSVHDLRLQV